MSRYGNECFLRDDRINSYCGGVVARLLVWLLPHGLVKETPTAAAPLFVVNRKSTVRPDACACGRPLQAVEEAGLPNDRSMNDRHLHRALPSFHRDADNLMDTPHTIGCTQG